jgi:UMF1 family MFS transporter
MEEAVRTETADRVQADAAAGRSDKLSTGARAWALFEGARNPYVILITIYVFAPYVTTTLIGDPIAGQELVSRWQTFASIGVMLTAPILGAAIDRMGQRKVGLFLIMLTMSALMAALWWTRPEYSWSLILALLSGAVMQVLFPWSEVFHNSLLVHAAGLPNAHRASGLALALGNAFALAALMFVAWAFVLPGAVDWWWVPKEALFGIGTEGHANERIVGPIAGAVFLIFSLPMFFLTPDLPRTSTPVIKALGMGARDLWTMMRSVKTYRDAVTFLVARMFYIDGMTAILIYAGIYAAGVMGWGPLAMLMYGIILSTLAILGGFVGGWLDHALGPKRAVQLEVLMSLAGIIALLGMSPTRILYLWTFDPATSASVWNGPFFTTWPEIVFLLIGFSNAIFITAHYASSRTLLTRLTPPAMTGTFFGVYALSGTATLWLGSLMVNLGTNIFHTQQGGFATIAVLLAVGFVGTLFVEGGDRGIMAS